LCAWMYSLPTQGSGPGWMTQGLITSLNLGWAASLTSCKMSPSLVVRKTPLCRKRASATSRSTWLKRARGKEARCPCSGKDNPTPWYIDRWPQLLPAPPPPGIHPGEGPLTFEKCRHPPPHGPADLGLGGLELFARGREKSRPSSTRTGAQ
jgi:hypothetical protein